MEITISDNEVNKRGTIGRKGEVRNTEGLELD